MDSNRAMNITIIGAGAIGGHIAAKLAAAGESVTVVARGEHLKAIREHGLKLKENGEEIVARVEATDRIAEAGGADLVVLGVKAHQLTPIAAEVASIVTPTTTVMTTQNGFPWWYFFKHGGPHEGVQLESVDPGGVIARHLPIDAIVAAGAMIILGIVLVLSVYPLPDAPWLYLPYIFAATLAAGLGVSYYFYRRNSVAATLSR